MKIVWNQVTWYSKLGAIILFLVVIPTLVFYFTKQYQEISALNSANLTKEVIDVKKTVQANKFFSDPLNGTYKIDDQNVTFTNGKSEQELAPGSASKIITRVFGQPVKGDLSADGQTDEIFFVSQETSGTGIFFYAVAAVNQGGKYAGTSAVFLGDRIAPQNINVANGVAIVNYAVRREGEPMTAGPSVGVSRFFVIKDGQLLEGKEKSGEIRVY